MSLRPEAVIRLHAYDPTILTTQEFEELQREVQSRIFSGIAGVSDRICLKLLEEHRWRYEECKRINARLHYEETS